jgi:MFS family permease
MKSTSPTARVLGASLAGTAIEFYDFFIYATAASLVFGSLFFPASSPTAGLMLSYATFSVAFIARPLGAFVFGHFGDRVGRKSTLVASLLLMGGSTVLIGVLPTYEAIGVFAPLLLCILRFGQGFGLGGEWGGAALLAVENAPPNYRARYGMFPQLGAPLGFIAANGLFLLIGALVSADQFLSWAWRVPFIASAALLVVGLWVRLKISETPEFVAALKASPPERVPLGVLLQSHIGATVCGIFSTVTAMAIFYLTTVFSLGYGVGTLGYSRQAFLSVLLLSIPFLAIGIVVAGYLADHRGSRTVMIGGCAAAAVLGFFVGPMLGSGSIVTVWAFLALAFFIMGLCYGPLGAWLPRLFPPHVRYTGASITFSVGALIGGGVSPIAMQALAQTGELNRVGWLLTVAGILGLVAVLSRKPEDVNR